MQKTLKLQQLTTADFADRSDIGGDVMVIVTVAGIMIAIVMVVTAIVIAVVMW